MGCGRGRVVLGHEVTDPGTGNHPEHQGDRDQQCPATVGHKGHPAPATGADGGVECGLVRDSEELQLTVKPMGEARLQTRTHHDPPIDRLPRQPCRCRWSEHLTLAMSTATKHPNLLYRDPVTGTRSRHAADTEHTSHWIAALGKTAEESQSSRKPWTAPVGGCSRLLSQRPTCIHPSGEAGGCAHYRRVGSGE
jgi:hypothetical protein